MSIKEEIHGLTDEILTNLERLVAIDSQLRQKGNRLGKARPRYWKRHLRLPMNLGLRL